MAPSPESSQPAAAPAGDRPAASLRTAPSALRIVLPVLLFLITAAVFAPSLRDDFVAWDDNHTFYENPHIQSLDAAHLHWMFTDVSYSMRYKPLSWLGYALIYRAGGLNPFLFHLTGLLFHSLNAVLLFFTLHRLFQIGFSRNQPTVPDNLICIFTALAALPWALHPLRVEPVARATDLTYSQIFFFTLVSLLCYLRFVAPAPGLVPRKMWYAAAVLAFAVAMLIYPFLIGYAVVLLALDFYPLRRFGSNPLAWRDPTVRRVWLEKIPFFLLAGLILLTFYGRLNPGDAFAQRKLDFQFSALSRVMQAFYVWAYYLWKPWAPFHLSPVYTTLVDFNPLGFPFIASALLVVGLTVLLFLKRRAWPLVFVLWICHLVLLVPALGLTEHPHYACDRYDYVAGVLWPILLAAACIWRCHTRPQLAFPAAAALLVPALVLSVMSLLQLGIWRDTPTLFNYIATQLGNDPYREDIHLRLGAWYADQKSFGHAIVQFQDALAVNPNSANGHNMLGAMFTRTGRTNDAGAQFAEAVRLAPNYVNARVNLASVLLQQGRTDDAIVQYQEALRLAPDDPDDQEILGVLLCNQARYAEAVPHLQAALQLQPNFAEAHNGLGVALFHQDKLDDAIAQFQTALGLKPDYVDAQGNLRAALDKKNGR